MSNVMFYNEAGQMIQAYIPKFHLFDEAAQSDAACERLTVMGLDARVWSWVQVFNVVGQ